MELADQELLAEFVVESQEGLANIEQQMLAIEANGANIDTDLVNGVFRTMHSIKGAAGFLGLNRVEVLAHGLEEILNHLRNREVIPTSELVTSVLSAADCMKSLFDAIEASNEADVSTHVTALQRFRPGQNSSDQEAAPQISADLNVATEPSPVQATEPLSPAVLEFLVECYENLDQMERDLVTLEEQPQAESLLRGIFRTMHTIKGGAGFLGLTALEALAHVAENLLAQLRSKERPLTPPIISLLLASVDACRAGLHRVELQGNDQGFDPQQLVKQLQLMIAAKEATLPSAPTTATATTPAIVASPAVVVVPDTKESDPLTNPSVEHASTTATTPVNNVASSEPSTTDKNAPSTSDSTIRVDVALLDKLMTRVGELVLARNQILQHANGLDDANLLNSAQRLNLITTELQESVMKTRMQPIGNVWSKFPRVVRDLSALLGKQVRIEMEGKETELDKTIVEAIKDPLTHVVRNSIDHGIETPQTRLAAGKPAEGVLYLRAYHEGGQVNIEISDDGAGLNIERIRNKAIQRGVVNKEQASRMSDRDVMQLVLLPGFSTAEKVTSVSGRGVGMDVVKTNIERIGGTIDLHSEAGRGTTVKIKNSTHACHYSRLDCHQWW
jgi:two-component system chemotaxis sensor kinase CheA